MGLYYARSTDGGLTFGEPTALALDNALDDPMHKSFGNDPDVVLREDGTILLAAGGFAPSVGGFVGTYVLSPQSASPSPTIVASCKVTKKGSAATVNCTGSTTGLSAGAMLMPAVRYSAKGTWTTPKSGHPAIDAQGSFSWRFAVPKGKKSISVYFRSGSTKSKAVTVSLK